MKTRPNSDEFPIIVDKYIKMVPDGNLLAILKDQHDQTSILVKHLTEQQANYKYAEGKWSLKTVIGHIADVERLWSYRLLRIGRGDARELPGYDRDIFAKSASLDHIQLKSILEDYSAVRQSTLTLLKNLHEEALARRGEFNSYSLSARAAAYIIAGHERHHISIVKSKYIV